MLIIRRQANGQESSQRLWSEGKGTEREGKRERRWKRREEGKGVRLRGRVGGWEIRMEEEQKREDGRERRNEQREGTLS